MNIRDNSKHIAEIRKQAALLEQHRQALLKIAEALETEGTEPKPPDKKPAAGYEHKPATPGQSRKDEAARKQNFNDRAGADWGGVDG